MDSEKRLKPGRKRETLHLTIVNDEGVEIISKKCTTCGEIKPLEEFHVFKKSWDNRAARCRQCSNDSRKKVFTRDFIRLPKSEIEEVLTKVGWAVALKVVDGIDL